MRIKRFSAANLIKVLLAIAFLAFLVLIYRFGFYDIAYARNSGRNYVKFLSLEQDDCTVVCSNDKFMLIDVGSLRDGGLLLEKELYRCGIRRIEYIVITHEQIERASALPLILEKFEVGHVIVGKGMFSDTSDLAVAVNEALAKKNFELTEVTAGDKIELEGAVLDFVWYYEGDIVSDNYLIPMLDICSKRFLFGNDVPLKEERNIVSSGIDITCDVFKASRHGGASSNGEEFIAAASPKQCVISCGEYEKVGFPSGKVLDRLSAHGIEYMTTFENGNILFDLNSKKISFEKEETQPK